MRMMAGLRHGFQETATLLLIEGPSREVLNSVLISKPAVPSVCHQLLKTRPADMDQTGMVATLEIDIRLPRQAIVYYDVEPIRGTKRRHRTRVAIDKERLNL